jgi:putative ABC transport system ATP-binding protein
MTTASLPLALRPTAPPASPSASQLRMALMDAAEAIGMPLPPQALELAVEEAVHLPWSPPVDTLVRVLGRAGLQARMGRSAAQVPDAGVGIALVPGPSPIVLVSRRRQGGRWSLVEVGPHGRSTVRLTARALASRYGAGALTWLHLEPSLPLEAVRMDPEQGPVSPWVRTRRFLALDRNDIGVVMVYALAIGALTLAAPAAVQALVNNVAFGTALQPVLVLTLLLAVGLSFSAVLRAFQAVVVEVVQQRLFVRVVSDLARRLPRVEPSALERADGRELANRFFDVVTIQKASASLLVDGLGVLLQTLIGFALLAFYHPVLLAFDVALAVVLLLVIWVLGRGAVKSALEESSAKYATAAWLETLAARPLLFKSARGPERAAHRADALAHRYLDARRRHFRHLLAQTAGGLAIQVLASTALLGLGGALVLSGQLTLGQLVAAELVVSALGYAFGRIGKSLEQVYDLVASINKLAMLVDLPTERTDGEPLRGEGPAQVRVHDPTAGQVTDVFVPAGHRVALNAGEATSLRIVDAVTGLDPLRSGWVEIDGVDVRTIELGSLRRAVVLVRSGDLIPGTILDNLRLGHPELGLEQAHALLRAVGLHDDVAALPRGVYEPVQLGGHPLRESQRRRLAVARALAAQPRLLVVDGVLDGMVHERDPLLTALFDRAASFTLLVRSRDPIVLGRCDQVVIGTGEAAT